MSNGKVFVSHSHDDNAIIMPLLAALDAWNVDYWFDVQGISAGQRLDERIQREMATRDLFLRVCTGALQRSFWSNLEASAFRGLQAEDRQRGRGDRRLLINLILDHGYQREPFDGATTYIDAVNMPRQAWLGDLRRALGVASTTSSATVSRRAALGYGAAALVTMSSTVAAAALLLDYKSRTSTATMPKYASGKHIWQMEMLSAKKDIPPDPAVVAGRLYVASGNAFAAYDLAKGRKRLWSNAYSPLFEFSSPVVLEDVAYYSVDSKLFAVSADTGKEIWTAETAERGGQFATSAAIDSGSVYIYGNGGSLYAFARSDGRLRWSSAVAAPGIDQNPSGPAVAGPAVFIGSADHTVYAFNTADGTQRWKFLTRGKVLSSPTEDSGMIYVGSSDGYVYALHSSDGSLKWKYLTQDAVRSTPAVTDGVIFVGSDDQYLYALDAETGEPFWRAPSGDLDPNTGIINGGGPLTGYPAVTAEAVCVLAQDQQIVRCFNRDDGSLRWSYQSADSLQNADPIATDGLILFGSGDQNLYAFGI